MNQYFLKFADKSEAMSVLAISAETAEGEIVKQTKDYIIDEVGVISKSTVVPAVYDSEGALVSEATTTTDTKEGYHVNILTDALHSSLAQYEVFPAAPTRKFAGV